MRIHRWHGDDASKSHSIQRRTVTTCQPSPPPLNTYYFSKSLFLPPPPTTAMRSTNYVPFPISSSSICFNLSQSPLSPHHSPLCKQHFLLTNHSPKTAPLLCDPINGVGRQAIPSAETGCSARKGARHGPHPSHHHRRLQASQQARGTLNCRYVYLFLHLLLPNPEMG